MKNVQNKIKWSVFRGSASIRCGNGQRMHWNEWKKNISDEMVQKQKKTKYKNNRCNSWQFHLRTDFPRLFAWRCTSMPWKMRAPCTFSVITVLHCFPAWNGRIACCCAYDRNVSEAGFYTAKWTKIRPQSLHQHLKSRLYHAFNGTNKREMCEEKKRWEYISPSLRLYASISILYVLCITTMNVERDEERIWRTKHF